MLISEVLDKAADLIEPEGAWTQGNYAKTKSGGEVGWDSPRASCFCFYGAIMHVTGLFQSETDNFVVERFFYGDEAGPADWNDAPERTQPEVVAKLREIAAQARAEDK